MDSKKIFEKHIIVCSHLYESKDTLDKEKKFAFPLCIEIIHEAYNTFWYCPKCIEIHHLSDRGTYVYGADDDFLNAVEKLDDFIVGEDLGRNPYYDFLNSEINQHITQNEFSKIKINVDPDDPLKNNADILRVPFGAKLKRGT